MTVVTVVTVMTVLTVVTEVTVVTVVTEVTVVTVVTIGTVVTVVTVMTVVTKQLFYTKKFNLPIYLCDSSYCSDSKDQKTFSKKKLFFPMGKHFSNCSASVW